MKLAASFFGAFCGWAIAWTTLMVGLSWAGGWRGIEDFEFHLWMPLFFTFTGWLVFGLPFVRFVPLHSRLLDLPQAFLVGALLSSAAYWILIGWALVDVAYMAMFAAGIGLVALPVYSVLARAAHSWESRERKRLLAGAIIAPLVLFGAFQWLAWPLLELSAPALAFRVGSWEAQVRITSRILARVRVGDKLAELRKLYPYVFQRDTTSMTGNAGSLHYRIVFQDGVVTEARVEPL